MGGPFPVVALFMGGESLGDEGLWGHGVEVAAEVT